MDFLVPSQNTSNSAIPTSFRGRTKLSGCCLSQPEPISLRDDRHTHTDTPGLEEAAHSSTRWKGTALNQPNFLQLSTTTHDTRKPESLVPWEGHCPGDKSNFGSDSESLFGLSGLRESTSGSGNWFLFSALPTWRPSNEAYHHHSQPCGVDTHRPLLPAHRVRAPTNGWVGGRLKRNISGAEFSSLDTGVACLEEAHEQANQLPGLSHCRLLHSAVLLHFILMPQWRLESSITKRRPHGTREGKYSGLRWHELPSWEVPRQLPAKKISVGPSCIQCLKVKRGKKRFWLGSVNFD
jgi:hypothetical protein